MTNHEVFGVENNVVPFALRFAKPLVSQEQVDEMLAGANTKVLMSRTSPTYVATGQHQDVVPDDE